MGKHSKKRRPLRMFMVAAATALCLMGVPTLSGCSAYESDDDTADQTTYCVIEDGTIIDLDDCDDDGYYNGYPTWLWLTTGHYSVGYRVPSSHRSALIRSNDPTARANAGLPRTGRPSARPPRSNNSDSGQGGSNAGRGSSGRSNHGFSSGTRSSGTRSRR